MNQKEKIRSAFWDYDFAADELLALSHGKRDKVGPLDRRRLFLRMLNYLSWYDFVQIVNPEEMLEVIDEDFLGKLNDAHMRKGLSYVIKLLRAETIPVTR